MGAAPQWVTWGLVVLIVAGFGVHLRRWAETYARSLHAGCDATAGTLLRSALEARRRPCAAADVWLALLLAAVVAIVLLAHGWSILAFIILGLVLVALAWLDAYSGLLPDALTGPLMVAGWLWGPLSLAEASSASALMGVGLASAAGLYRWLCGREGFGGGDIKYLAALAGWLGVTPACMVLWLASVLGGLAWLCLSRVRREGACPFGPCMTIAVLPVMIWGEGLLSYSQHFNG